MLDIPKIKAVLKEASQWDMDYPIFGSHSHAHLFRPPLPMEELDAWEELMELRLPEDYRTYLTCLGNGGAGPAYGIAPFSCPLHDYLQELAVFSDSQAQQFEDLARMWYEYFHTDQDQLYDTYCEQTPEEQRIDYFKWTQERYHSIESAVKQPLFRNGQLFIANQGCSDDIYLLLNGSNRGFCHGNSDEYDYSYPFWYQPADHREAITWPQYRETLQTFEDYLMAYVRTAEQVCQDLSMGKRMQFLQEQLQVREFQAAVELEDWGQLLTMLRFLEPAALSLKSRSFYLYYEKVLREKLPDRPEIPCFFQKVDKTRRYSGGKEFTSFWCTEDADGLYPYPDFSDFVKTF